MNNVLAGRKGAFLWNMAPRGGLTTEQAARAALEADMTSLAVKAYDGPEWFDQGDSFRNIRRQLLDLGIHQVGAWGYHYGRDVAGELALAAECAGYGEADFVILNVEDPDVETNPQTPALWASGLKQLRGLLPDYPLYFCSHAQPAFHPSQPYFQAAQADVGMMPMAYHTAMHCTPERSIELTVKGLADFGLDIVPWVAAGALYAVQGYPCRAEDVIAWGNAALGAGSSGLYWWDLEAGAVRPELLDGVAAIVIPGSSPAPACATS